MDQAAKDADTALLAKALELWGNHLEVLLEDAQVYVTDAPLTNIQRQSVRVMIMCGERR